MKAIGLFLIGVGLFTFSSCDEIFNENVRGKGVLAKQTLKLGSFDEVDVTSAMKLYIRQGDKQSVVVKSHQNILDRLDAKVRSGRLEFDLDPANYSNLDLSIYITVPKIKYIGASGASEIEFYHFVGLTDLELDFSGATNFTVKGPETDIDHLTVDLSGAGELNALLLKCRQVDLDLSGASSCEIFATEELNIDASGASEIRYKGKPRLRQDISGASEVEPLNDKN